MQVDSTGTQEKYETNKFQFTIKCRLLVHRKIYQFTYDDGGTWTHAHLSGYTPGIYHCEQNADCRDDQWPRPTASAADADTKLVSLQYD